MKPRAEVSGMTWNAFCAEIRLMAMEWNLNCDIEETLIKTHESKIRNGELR